MVELEAFAHADYSADPADSKPSHLDFKIRRMVATSRIIIISSTVNDISKRSSNAIIRLIWPTESHSGIVWLELASVTSSKETPKVNATVFFTASILIEKIKHSAMLRTT